MSTPDVRSPNRPDGDDEPAGTGPAPEGDRDDYSPALAAWALTLTILVAASLVVALWTARGL
jgi:hypothetical protein